jgi:rubrerythrin
MSIPNLLDAIRVVKENERISVASYADAALRITNPMGKKLFEQLAEFERFHYKQLSDLEESLEKESGYVNYEGKEFPMPPVFEIAVTLDPGKKSVMTIISAAIDLENKAEKAYSDLASKITDPKGHEMFRMLAEEEHKHYRILMEAYWTLNNIGTWTWSEK